MMKNFRINVIGKYVNGNTTTTIFEDGTKIRLVNGQSIDCAFLECIDVNTSYRCDRQCKFCYQNSTKDGKVADLNAFDDMLDSIHQYTELALNCNDPTNSQFEQLLIKCKQRGLIANVTINQYHFIRHFDIIKRWSEQRLIHGVGVSVQTITDTTIDRLHQINNVVVHTIVGATSPATFYALCDHDIKLLVLGYKDIGRGHDYQIIRNEIISYNRQWLYRSIERLIDRFNTMCFDNLACDQLNVKRFVKDWSQFYMGDEGTHSMYIDLVNKTYSISSVLSNQISFNFPRSNNVNEMFKHVKQII